VYVEELNVQQMSARLSFAAKNVLIQHPTLHITSNTMMMIVMNHSLVKASAIGYFPLSPRQDEKDTQRDGRCGKQGRLEAKESRQKVAA
jgi:hypothetical protein